MKAREDKSNCNGLNTENLNIQGILHSIDSYFDQAECTKTIRAANNLLEEIYEKLSSDTLSSESCSEEWQPDWSKAPKWAKWWAMDEDGDCYWYENMPMLKRVYWLSINLMPNLDNSAPSFDYTGCWRDSLQERPE